MKAPKLALFDLDDTLFAHRDAVAGGILDHLHALGGPYAATNPSDAAAYWHELEELHYHSYLAGTFDYEGQRRARARDFAAWSGVELSDTGAAAFFADYFECYVERWALHADALPCLDALAAAGVRLGLITNGDPAFQTRKIEQIGLAERFEHVVFSGALGITKPDPRIFQHACSLFDVAPADAVYIGDRLATDAIGAAHAGLTGIWLDRTGRPPSDAEARAADAANVIPISSLAELPPLLAAA